MTDQELLELAAKAAGKSGAYMERSTGVGIKTGPIGRLWNPLTDDGDALRLAVTLGFAVFCPDADDPTVVVRDYREPQTQVTELAEPDFLTATRRAIVQAAAKLPPNLNSTAHDVV